MNSLVAGLHMAAILSNRPEVGKTRVRSGATATNIRRWRRDLNRAEAAQGHSKQNDDIDALWRKRAELAKGIVEAAAPTIEDAVLKVAITTSLLLEGDLGVGLTPQCLEECDRALAQKGDGEQCLKALESELWALCQRVEEQTAALEARWDASSRARKPEDQTTSATASHSQGRGTSCTSPSGASRDTKP